MTKPIITALAALFASTAVAAPEGTASFEVVEGKLCTNIENRACAQEATTFSTGDKAWLWMKLRPEEGDPQLRIRWSLDGNPYWTMDPVPARLGRLWYYKTIYDPGHWKAEVLDDDDEVKYSVELEATGESIDPTGAGDDAAETADAGMATGESEVADSDHVEVVEMELTEKIDDRKPVSPSRSFGKGTKVYAWAKLDVKAPETQITLRWSNAAGVQHTSDPVTVKKSPSWRTWLYKTVTTAGEWKVEVLDVEDNVIHTETFQVGS